MTPNVMTAQTAIPIVSMQVRIEDTVTKKNRQVPFGYLPFLLSRNLLGCVLWIAQPKSLIV